MACSIRSKKFNLLFWDYFYT